MERLGRGSFVTPSDSICLFIFSSLPLFLQTVLLVVACGLRARRSMTGSSGVVIAAVLWDEGSTTHSDCGPVITCACSVILISADSIKCTAHFIQVEQL